MSMHVNDGQRTPYNPDLWDQYDTHPGHPETIQVETAVGSTATSSVVEDVVFDYYSGCGSNQLPALMPNGQPLRVVA